MKVPPINALVKIAMVCENLAAFPVCRPILDLECFSTSPDNDSYSRASCEKSFRAPRSTAPPVDDVSNHSSLRDIHGYLT